MDSSAARNDDEEARRDQCRVPFLVIYGISGNTHRFWSLTSAFERLGYRPQDDSQVRFADRIAEIAKAPRADGTGPRPWE